MNLLSKISQVLSEGQYFNIPLLGVIICISIMLLVLCIILTKKSGMLHSKKEKKYAAQKKTSVASGTTLS